VRRRIGTASAAIRSQLQSNNELRRLGNVSAIRTNYKSTTGSPLASSRRGLFEVRGVHRQQRREILRRCAAPAECVWKQIPRRREKSARGSVGMTT